MLTPPEKGVFFALQGKWDKVSIALPLPSDPERIVPDQQVNLFCMNRNKTDLLALVPASVLASPEKAQKNQTMLSMCFQISFQSGFLHCEARSPRLSESEHRTADNKAVPVENLSEKLRRDHRHRHNRAWAEIHKSFDTLLKLR